VAEGLAGDHDRDREFNPADDQAAVFKDTTNVMGQDANSGTATGRDSCQRQGSAARYFRLSLDRRPVRDRHDYARVGAPECASRRGFERTLAAAGSWMSPKLARRSEYRASQ